jgi:hypothetical protein
MCSVYMSLLKPDLVLFCLSHIMTTQGLFLQILEKPWFGTFYILRVRVVSKGWSRVGGQSTFCGGGEAPDHAQCSCERRGPFPRKFWNKIPRDAFLRSAISSLHTPAQRSLIISVTFDVWATIMCTLVHAVPTE